MNHQEKGHAMFPRSARWVFLAIGLVPIGVWFALRLVGRGLKQTAPADRPADEGSRERTEEHIREEVPSGEYAQKAG